MDIERLKVDREYWDEVAPEWARYYLRSGAFLSDDMGISHAIPRPEPRQVEWGGEGWPPVDCKLEYNTAFGNWVPAKCIAIGHDRHEKHAVIQTTNRLYLEDKADKMRPIRTKEQREREELKEIISGERDNCFPHQPSSKRLADAIIASGWRKAND